MTVLDFPACRPLIELQAAAKLLLYSANSGASTSDRNKNEPLCTPPSVACIGKSRSLPPSAPQVPGSEGVFWGPFRGWMLQPVFFTQSPGQSCLAGRVRLRARKFGRSDLEAVGAVTFFKPFSRSPLHSCYQALVLPMMMLPYMICLFSRPLLVGTKIKTGQKKLAEDIIHL